MARWRKAQCQPRAAWVGLAKGLRAGAAEGSSAAQSARSAARGWTWKLWAGVLIASVTPILALLIASWLWLEPQIIEQQGGIWLVFKLK